MMLHTKSFVHQMFTILVVFCTSFVLWSGQNVAAGDESAKTVAVLPFVMHAPSSMAYLQEGLRDMLASRLAANAGVVIVEQSRVNSLLKEPGKNLPQQEIVDLARQLGADYVVSGSLTSLGGSMSLDAKVYAADESQPPLDFYTAAEKESEVIGAVNQLSWDIGTKVFGAAAPAAAQPAQTTQTVPATAGDDTLASFKTEHPDKVYKKTVPGQAGTTLSPIVLPSALSAMQGFTKTQNLKISLTGFDVGDVDGDGQLDVVMADERKVYAYHLIDNRLIEIAAVEMPARSKVHAVSLGDMDGNGRAEIYISAADNRSPYSWAYEWDGSSLALLLGDIPWYIRVIDIPREGPTLVGQRGGLDSTLLAGIFKLMRNGDELQPLERITMPDYVNVFDFALADLDGDSVNEIVGINKADRVYVIRPDGSVLWVSDEYYGGTSRYIGFDDDLISPQGININSTPTYQVTGREGLGKRIYLPSRIVVADVNRDGRDDVIINKNLSYASRHVENYKRFQSSEVYAMAWNGIALGELWHTKKIDGYIPDFQFLPRPDGEKEAKLYIGLVLSTGWTSSFTQGESTMLMYDLELAGEKETAAGGENEK